MGSSGGSIEKLKRDKLETTKPEAKLIDLAKNVFGERKLKFQGTDPTTGKHETVELGGEG